MMVIACNAVKEKLRSKVIYVVMVLGMLFMLLVSTGDGLSINGVKITSFSQRVPIAISINMFLSSLIAIMISLSTIPKEYERKTTHLVLSRGIKPYVFTFALTLANVMTSLIAVFALNASLFVFAFILGEVDVLLPIFISILVVSVNVVMLSTLVSLLSIFVSSFVNTLISVGVFFLGIFHGMMMTFLMALQGGKGFLVMLMRVVPNFSLVQRQAQKVMLGEGIDVYPILVMLLFAYICLSMTMVFARKEV